MRLGLIIPTLNEEANIIELIKHLQRSPAYQQIKIVVSDGSSTDDTVSACAQLGIKVIQSPRGRAIQMNHGARSMDVDVYYFVHADTRPPLTFVEDIMDAVQQGFDLGSYRFKFDSGKFLLKINSYFTRFNQMWTNGGDQSLFITKRAYEALEGYREEYVIMEEYDLLKRAKQMEYQFKVLPKDIMVSARKYSGNNYFRVQIANLVVFNMFRFGCQPQRILNTYRRLIDYRS
jgi:rSAM/selenodomain-associated transferase 2